MAMLNGRKRLLIWIPAALIAVAVMVAVFLQARRPPLRAAHLTSSGNPRKAPRCFLVTSNAAFAIPSMDPGGVLPRISPERNPVLPPWGGL